MTLSRDRIAQLDVFVRAANYLGATQIYRRDNYMLRAPLSPAHIRARLLGHWGTQPGINMIYAHLNRLAQDTDQGPTFINALMTRKSAQMRIFLPPDANCALHVLRDCLDSRGLINLIVTSRKPQLQWLDATAAAVHCTRGISIWDWASDSGTPDVILAGCGDVPTREIMAAARLLSGAAPDLVVRVVNVVDLLRLETPQRHPRGMDDAEYAAIFGEDLPVVFAFHGYPSVIHDAVGARPNSRRFDVHGYQEEGTTTTPFDMLVLNEMDRFHLAIGAVQTTARLSSRAKNIIFILRNQIDKHLAYITKYDEDMPEVMNWRWAT